MTTCSNNHLKCNHSAHRILFFTFVVLLNYNNCAINKCYSFALEDLLFFLLGRGSSDTEYHFELSSFLQVGVELQYTTLPNILGMCSAANQNACRCCLNMVQGNHYAFVRVLWLIGH